MQTHRTVGRNRFVGCLAVLLLLTAAGAKAADPPDERPLSFGVLPFMSPIALLKRFAPLRDHLAERIGQPVVLETARDYPEFVQRTAERRYDVLLTAPHFTLLALDSGHYTVSATYLDELAAVVLVRAGDEIRAATDLAGKVIATPPREAIVTRVGQRLLEAQMTGHAPPVYRRYLSHNAAYHAVAGGGASAAVVTVNVVKRATSAEFGLVELTRSPGFPAMGILTAADLPPEVRRRATDAFIELTEHEAGRELLRSIGYPGYRAAAPEEFQSLRSYTSDQPPAVQEP